MLPAEQTSPNFQNARLSRLRSRQLSAITEDHADVGHRHHRIRMLRAEFSLLNREVLPVEILRLLEFSLVVEDGGEGDQRGKRERMLGSEHAFSNGGCLRTQ